MVLRIVLEGIDNASDDFKNVKKNAEETSDTFTNLEKKGAALVLTVNGLASGLNQMSGGLRKTADAMERTGRGTEEQREALRGMSDTMELVAGPIEVFSGAVTLLASAAYLAGAAGLSFTGVWSAVSTAALAVAGALSATVVVIGAIVAAVAIAVYLLYDYTDGFREWGQVIDNVNYKLEYCNNLLKGFAAGARDASHTIQNISLSGVRSSISDELAGFGSRF